MTRISVRFWCHREAIECTFWNNYSVPLLPTLSDIQSLSTEKALHFSPILFLEVFCFSSVDSLIEVKIALVLLVWQFFSEDKMTSDMESSLYLCSIPLVIRTDNMPFCSSRNEMVCIYGGSNLSPPLVHEVEYRLYFLDVVSVVRPPFPVAYIHNMDLKIWRSIFRSLGFFFWIYSFAQTINLYRATEHISLQYHFPTFWGINIHRKESIPFQSYPFHTCLSSQCTSSVPRQRGISKLTLSTTFERGFHSSMGVFMTPLSKVASHTKLPTRIELWEAPGEKKQTTLDTNHFQQCVLKVTSILEKWVNNPHNV